ncbi:MAG TPA: DMT family transporter [Candidatus Limnocylindria bacterium]|nr:DMT family transporter [Candidatus Limnocylindria bacterium]
MEALLYGVGAAIAFGFGDYAAAMATRRVGVVRTSLGMQTVGLAAYAVTLAALGRWPTFDLEQVPYALVLSVVGIVSLAALYRAFAIGPIAVVSPVVASYAALTVVLIVIFLGEHLTGGQAVAIAVTFVGVAVASTDIRELRRTLGRPTEGVRIGFYATLGFAVWSAIFAVGVRETDGLALIVVQRAFSIALLAMFVIARGVSLRPLASRPALALVAVTGVLDTGANVLLALGIAAGYASFVMTGSGAYPLIPALLAISVLRERLAPNQYVGVAVLVAGLVALGLQS